MARLTKFEIVEKTLDYLQRNDVESAKKFLEEVRYDLLREIENKQKRERKPLVVRCLDLLEEDEEFRKSVEDKLVEIYERIQATPLREYIEEEFKRRVMEKKTTEKK